MNHVKLWEGKKSTVELKGFKLDIGFLLKNLRVLVEAWGRLLRLNESSSWWVGEPVQDFSRIYDNSPCKGTHLESIKRKYHHMIFVSIIQRILTNTFTRDSFVLWTHLNQAKRNKTTFLDLSRISFSFTHFMTHLSVGGWWTPTHPEKICTPSNWIMKPQVEVEKWEKKWNHHLVILWVVSLPSKSGIFCAFSSGSPPPKNVDVIPKTRVLLAEWPGFNLFFKSIPCSKRGFACFNDPKKDSSQMVVSETSHDPTVGAPKKTSLGQLLGDNNLVNNPWLCGVPF